MAKNDPEQARIYALLRKLEDNPSAPTMKERRNSKRSRAHRHEIFTTTVELTPVQRARAIANLVRLWEDGIVTDESFILVVKDIVR
jgi:methylphosphotriester-DNA--protein-cysteine methyltransferase